MKPLLLWSDLLIFLLVIALGLFFYSLQRDPRTRERWGQVFGTRLGMATFVVILAYVSIALLDSLHFRRALEPDPSQQSEQVYYDNKVVSVLDVLLRGMGDPDIQSRIHRLHGVVGPAMRQVEVIHRL